MLKYYSTFKIHTLNFYPRRYGYSKNNEKTELIYNFHFYISSRGNHKISVKQLQRSPQAVYTNKVFCLFLENARSRRSCGHVITEYLKSIQTIFPTFPRVFLESWPHAPNTVSCNKLKQKIENVNITFAYFR